LRGTGIALGYTYVNGKFYLPQLIYYCFLSPFFALPTVLDYWYHRLSRAMFFGLRQRQCALFRTPLRQAPTRLFTAKFSANFLLAPTRHAPIKKGSVNFLRQKIFESIFASKLFCVKTDIVANF